MLAETCCALGSKCHSQLGESHPFQLKSQGWRPDKPICDSDWEQGTDLCADGARNSPLARTYPTSCVQPPFLNFISFIFFFQELHRLRTPLSSVGVVRNYTVTKCLLSSYPNVFQAPTCQASCCAYISDSSLYGIPHPGCQGVRQDCAAK